MKTSLLQSLRWNNLSNEVCASMLERFSSEAKQELIESKRRWTVSDQIMDLFHLEEEKERTFELLV